MLWVLCDISTNVQLLQHILQVFVSTKIVQYKILCVIYLSKFLADFICPKPLQKKPLPKKRTCLSCHVAFCWLQVPINVKYSWNLISKKTTITVNLYSVLNSVNLRKQTDIQKTSFLLITWKSQWHPDQNLRSKSSMHFDVQKALKIHLITFHLSEHLQQLRETFIFTTSTQSLSFIFTLPLPISGKTIQGKLCSILALQGTQIG